MKKNAVPSVLFFLLLLAVPLIFLVDQTKNPFLIQSVIMQMGVSLIFIYLLVKGFILPKTSLDKFWLGWLTVVILSLSAVSLTQPAGRKAILILSGENILFLLLNCVLVFYLSFYLNRNKYFFKWVTRISLGVAFLASLYGLLQYFGVEPFWPQQLTYFQGRVTSTFGNPAFLASFLVLIIPLVVAKLLNTINKKSKIPLAVLLLLTITMLVVTAARSAWLGFLVSLVIVLLYLFKLGLRTQIKTVFKVVLVVLTMGLTIIFFSAKRELIEQRFTATLNPLGMGTSLNQRFLIWCCAGEMFIEHPLTGQGWGLFELFYPKYQAKYLQSPDMAALKTHGNHAHNELLHIAAELGLFGLVLSVYFLNILIRRVNTLLLTDISVQDKLYVIGLFAGLIGLIVDSMFNVSLHIVSQALYFWLAVGILFGWQKNQPQSEQEVNSSKILRLTASSAFSFIVILNFLQLAGAINNFSGMKLMAKGYLTEGVGKLEKAFRLFPWDVDTAYELGNGYFRQGRLGEAEHLYQEAATLNFSYEEIFTNQAIVQMLSGRLAESKHNFQKALALNPNSEQIKENLAKIR